MHCSLTRRVNIDNKKRKFYIHSDSDIKHNSKEIYRGISSHEYKIEERISHTHTQTHKVCDNNTAPKVC